MTKKKTNLSDVQDTLTEEETKLPIFVDLQEAILPLAGIVRVFKSEVNEDIKRSLFRPRTERNFMIDVEYTDGSRQTAVFLLGIDRDEQYNHLSSLLKAAVAE